MPLPSPIPDDPRKWLDWKNYNSSNYYDRLCLSIEQNPSNELIEDHTRQLLVWWQKKLPLKNQPSNPLAQMLREGLDIAPRYLAEARLGLCNPETRKQIDANLLADVKIKNIEEFRRIFSIITAGGTLGEDGESTLQRFGLAHGLGEEEIASLIEEEMVTGQIERVVKEEPAPVASPTTTTESTPRIAGNAAEEFWRYLKLSVRDSEEMTDDLRDGLINIAENLGLNGGDAEDIVDDFLEELDSKPITAPPASARPAAAPARPPAARPISTPAIPARAGTARIIPAAGPVMSAAEERQKFPTFTNSTGQQMFLIPSGTFQMGGTDADAAPNEAPRSKVTLTRFYMSRHPVTCAAYEQFNTAHRSNRAPWADDQHPVLYVSSLDAIKFCQWLSAKERKKYRLPTEAEWEYAARGTDDRIYPWGNHTATAGKGNTGDLANFADANTNFSWSDPDINDGFAETSPVGSYPRGASAFGLEDMAGNVWEWCQDYYESYKPADKKNPKGPMNGNRRVWRGGSWKSRFNSLRASCRNMNTADFRCNDLGFRLVCDCE